MRLEDLATRLVAVEAKVATLTGTSVNTTVPTTNDELDARLSVVEAQVNTLVAAKTQEHIDVIISSPADSSSAKVEDVVALSPSVNVPEAADIVADVVDQQIATQAIDDVEVAVIVAAAVNAVVTADPEIVMDPAAITEAITNAVSEAPAPSPEVAEAAAEAVANIIASATGDEIAEKVYNNIVEAIAAPADPALDALESRLGNIEQKIDTLLGK
jgi:hypothetical protein